MTYNNSAIENGFPIGFISQIAELESWRKEINRPTSYIHKWWAKRLGSVFRAIILASCAKQDQNIIDLFYKPNQFEDKVIYDPFMGSGVTVYEAMKLGCRTIGRDINPVSYFMVSSATHEYSIEEVIKTYNQIEANVGERIKSFYTTTMDNGDRAAVLYYFWVKTVPCPSCNQSIDLFKKRIFVKNAYPSKHPDSKAICPKCYAVNDTLYNSTQTVCNVCGEEYNPNKGVFEGKKVVCPACNFSFKLIDVVRKMGRIPSNKMYAKLVLHEGNKIYLPINESDHASYRLAEEMLPIFSESIPISKIEPGYNTDQVLNYNYNYWHEMFNARQLVSLAILVSEIQRIKNPELKKLFTCLFSGSLEFNNMFASFKGEGTGAVRHMFYHHILKPELTPLEANVWGTPKSSGSFSTLFQSRILRALDYKTNPFEIKAIVNKEGKICSEKIFDLSKPINKSIVRNFTSFQNGNDVYLSLGDSSKTDIADKSVDVVVTDPPFFDNVHYSQLADFFYVWLRQIIGEHELRQTTTRSQSEVQNTDAVQFAERLRDVFQDCYRVLKNNGLLVFTYHHSRMEGWAAIHRSIRSSGFYVVKIHPIKSEMSVSVPVQQAKIPINYDLIIVCKKTRPNFGFNEKTFISSCVEDASKAVQELRKFSMDVSLADVKNIIMGCILSHISAIDDFKREANLLLKIEERVDIMAQEVLFISTEKIEKKIVNE